MDYGMNLRIVYRQTRGCYWHCVFEWFEFELINLNWFCYQLG
jgi:hypothetical protein